MNDKLDLERFGALRDAVEAAARKSGYVIRNVDVYDNRADDSVRIDVTFMQDSPPKRTADAAKS